MGISRLSHGCDIGDGVSSGSGYAGVDAGNDGGGLGSGGGRLGDNDIGCVVIGAVGMV